MLPDEALNVQLPKVGRVQWETEQHTVEVV